jgi:class I fructose-bisphosphate aldolase
MTGRDIRMGRLFSGGDNAVVVAADHGEFDGPLPGMINLPEVVKVVPSHVDGVLLSPGMLPHCGHIFSYRGGPLAIVRLNWNSVYCFHWGYKEAVGAPALRPAQAVRLGADIVLVSLTLRTGSEATDAANVEVFCNLASEAHDLGLPVIGEYFPPQAEELAADDLREQVFTGCRVISELGADLIKTFYTTSFDEVTEAVPVPVLALGASKLPKEVQALQLARRATDDGARGVVFGRNVLQSRDPTRFALALCDVVKRGADPVDAAAKYGVE